MTTRRLEPPPSYVGEFNHIWRKWLSALHDLLGSSNTVTYMIDTATPNPFPYTAMVSDELLLCIPSTGNVAVTMPSGTPGKVIYVKNAYTANTVNVSPATGDTISNTAGTTLGAGPLGITAGLSYRLVFDENTGGWWTT